MVNPLSIFTADQLSNLTRDNLKKHKKAILLEFQFTSDPQIVVNGVHVDKNTVLNIFDELEKNLEHHTQALDYPLIQNFLVSGDESFISSRNTINEIIIFLEDKPDLEERLALKMSEKILFHIKKSSPKFGITNLLKYNVLINSFSESNRRIAYEKAVNYFEDYLHNHLEMISDPFKPGTNRVKFKPEIKAFFDDNLVKLVRLIPRSFTSIHSKLELLCVNHIINPAIDRNKYLSYNTYENNLVIENAGKIAQYGSQDDWYKSVTNITARQDKSDKSVYKLVSLIIILVIAGIRIYLIATSTGEKPYRASINQEYLPVKYANQGQEENYRLLEQFIDENSNQLLNFKEDLNADLFNFNPGKQFNLQYYVNSLPMDKENIIEIVKNDIRNNIDRSSIFKVEFIHRDYNNVRSTHI